MTQQVCISLDAVLATPTKCNCMLHASTSGKKNKRNKQMTTQMKLDLAIINLSV